MFSFYRPPRLDLSNFYTVLNRFMDKATWQQENIILMGDINIDTNSETAAGKENLAEFCDVFDSENLIKGSTCETMRASTSIDVILTNKKGSSTIKRESDRCGQSKKRNSSGSSNSLFLPSMHFAVNFCLATFSGVTVPI